MLASKVKIQPGKTYLTFFFYIEKPVLKQERTWHLFILLSNTATRSGHKVNQCKHTVFNSYVLRAAWKCQTLIAGAKNKIPLSRLGLADEEESLSNVWSFVFDSVTKMWPWGLIQNHFPVPVLLHWCHQLHDKKATCSFPDDWVFTADDHTLKEQTHFL